MDNLNDDLLFHKARARWDSLPIAEKKSKMMLMKTEKIFAECSFIQLPADIRTILIVEAIHARD